MAAVNRPHRRAAALFLAGALPIVHASAQAPDVSLDSLLNTRVNAASKYEQRVADAPASVTILSSDDIRLRGFRTMQEALESVRGFYVSNDRNYPYLGARGFSRPTDYNNRVLLLIDGHAINEQIWASAPVGSDLPINLEAVERIEIVRGPGSAMYGSSAMFAVINVVTKTGAALSGVRVAARVGSDDLREIGVVAGREFQVGTSVSFSALAALSNGDALYFPEYDAPATGDGVARGLDWEDGFSALSTVEWNSFTLRSGGRSRLKGIPTAAYASLFGDARARTHDETVWADLSRDLRFGGSVTSSIRAFADGYRYTGAYPGDAGPAFRDRANNVSAGFEGQVVWDATSRNRLSVGFDGRRLFQAVYRELQTDGAVDVTDSRYNAASLYAQHELQIAARATVVAGARVDARSRERGALSPRLALILRPDARTVGKLLYGEAFRAPSPSEVDFTTNWYSANPALRPERIRTGEIEIERRMSGTVTTSLSAYRYEVTDLIDQVSDAAGIHFENVSRAQATGVEAQIDLAPSWSFWTARGTFAFQRARDEATKAQLTNSPEHVTTLSLVPRPLARFRPALDLRHESGRRTIAGPSTSAFTRADLNLGHTVGSADVSLRVTNLLNGAYAIPAGFEHLQVAIPQDGRKLSLRLGWGF